MRFKTCKWAYVVMPSRPREKHRIMSNNERLLRRRASDFDQERVCKASMRAGEQTLQSQEQDRVHKASLGNMRTDFAETRAE